MRLVSLILVNMYSAASVRSPWFLGHHWEASHFLKWRVFNTFVDWEPAHLSSFSLLSCLCEDFSSNPEEQEHRACFHHPLGISISFLVPTFSSVHHDVIYQALNSPSLGLLMLSISALFLQQHQYQRTIHDVRLPVPFLKYFLSLSIFEAERQKCTRGPFRDKLQNQNRLLINAFW